MSEEERKELPIEHDPRMWAMLQRDRARLNAGGYTTLFLVVAMLSFYVALFYFMGSK